MSSTATIRQKALIGEGENLASPIKYAEAEREGVHMQKRRLYQRTQVGKDWDGAANDNIAWPLATALIREGNTELLKAAVYYRKVHDTAKSEAKLGGSSVSIGNGVALDRYSYVRLNGTVTYSRPRQKQSADTDIPAKRYTAPPAYDTIDHSSEEVKVSNWSSVPKPWNGDAPVNNMIDAQRRLSDLRARLGPLVESLEMAVIDGATYEAIGHTLGQSHKVTATAAGRSVVHIGLVTVRDAIGNVKRSDLA